MNHAQTRASNTPRRLPSHDFIPFPILLGVDATVGVGGLLNPSSNSDTALVATRVLNIGVSPDTPSAIDAVGAGNQILSIVLKVVVAVDSPTATGSGGRLGTGRVLDHALAFRSYG